MVFESQVRGGLDMRSILIAHYDHAVAEQLSAELCEGDYPVIDCAGPWPSALRRVFDFDDSKQEMLR